MRNTKNLVATGTAAIAACALSVSALTGCVTDSKPKDAASNSNIVVNVNNDGASAASSYSGNTSGSNATITDSKPDKVGTTTTFKWHVSTDYFDDDSRQSEEAGAEAQEIEVTWINADEFEFTTPNGNHIVGRFTSKWLDWLNDYEVSLHDDEGHEVFMPTNGGEYMYVATPGDDSSWVFL